ncbi:hypothetical protein ABG067_003993 [Albugo candida]
MKNFYVMATRAGNTIYVASSNAAVIGREKGMKAIHVASEAASNAAAVGKVKASATATTAVNVANAGKRKAALVLNTAKNRLAKGSQDNLGSPCEDDPASTSDYCRYDPSEKERIHKKGQVDRNVNDHASRRHLGRSASSNHFVTGENKRSRAVSGRRKGRVSHQSLDISTVKATSKRQEVSREESTVFRKMSDSDPSFERQSSRSKKSWLEVAL